MFYIFSAFLLTIFFKSFDGLLFLLFTFCGSIGNSNLFLQVGDLVRSSCKIPAMPVKPIEGDSYPLGALPTGTLVCLVQWLPDTDEVKVIEKFNFLLLFAGEGSMLVLKI